MSFEVANRSDTVWLQNPNHQLIDGKHLTIFCLGFNPPFGGEDFVHLQ